MTQGTANGSQSMKGKVALVTGANSGLGKVTALELARQGATVVMLCRNADKGRAAVEEVKAASGNPNVELLVGDVSSQSSIHAAVKQFTAKHPALHVLVNNAGVNLGTRQLTPDGYEATFATNHLGPFLLTNLLLDALKAGAPSRVITVASGAHRMGKINFDDLQFEKKYRAMGAYSQSKLANVFFGYELARRLKGTGITSNLADPGVAATSLGGDQWIFRLIVKLPFVPKAEDGAATSVYLATAKEVENATGQYFIKKKAAKSSPLSLDEAVARQLWDVSAKMTGIA